MFRQQHITVQHTERHKVQSAEQVVYQSSFNTIDASIVVFWVLSMPALLPISCPVFDHPQSCCIVYTVHQMSSKSTTGSACAIKTNQTFIVYFIIYLSPL